MKNEEPTTDLGRLGAAVLGRSMLALALALILHSSFFILDSSFAYADGELVVEEVRTDAFPRIVLRFALSPADGLATGDLAQRGVLIVEAGQNQQIVDVYPVGRAAGGRSATYEAVWTSRLRAEPGDKVGGRIVVQPPGLPDSASEFSYTMPLLARGRVETLPAPISQLQAVPRPSLERSDIIFVGSLAAVLAGIAMLCVLGGFGWRTAAREVEKRLATWVATAAPSRAGSLVARGIANRRRLNLTPAIRLFARIGSRLMSPKQAEKLRQNLILAGRPSAIQYSQFIAIKTGLGLGLFGLGYWLMFGEAPFINVLAVALCMALAGFLLPSIWLGRAIKKRQYQLRKSLPDALDLMTIGVSAGLSFDGALAEIVEKWDNALSREFGVVLGELRMGTGRREALTGLVERTRVEEIQTMVTQLIQADELGMSLTETLLTLSNQMRIKRRQHAEELAHKAAVKMLVPLVFLIFPALFVVILGPSVPDLYKFISQGPT